jgi:septum formation protein
MILTNIKNKRLILGSASPRRKKLMEGLGLNFIQDPHTSFKEKYPENMPATEIPLFLAKGKSHGFRELEKDEILITADTIVISDGQVLGKPKDRHDAVHMLKLIRNNTHTVETGVCIRTLEKEVSFSCLSKVVFGEISDEEIGYYLDNYSPYDKAGSYGIQEWIGYMGIISVEGSFYNVMGLPVHMVYRELGQFLK